MGVKLFGTSGIDKRKNYITRDKKLLSDGLNIRRTKNDEYSKRDGQVIYKGDNLVMSTSENFPTATNSDRDFIMYKKQNSVFYCNGEDYFDSERSGVFIPAWGYGFDLSEWATTGRSMCAVESLGCLLFTHYMNPTSVMKYDGHDVYFAGLPAPIVKDQVKNTNGYYNILYYSFIDNQGNQIDGPSTIIKSTATFKLDVNDLYGFKKSQILTKDNKVISALNRTIVVDNETDPEIYSYKVGDKIPVRSYGQGAGSIAVYEDGSTLPSSTTLMLEIEEIISGLGDLTFKFTTESLKGHTININNPAFAAINFHCGLILKQWTSYDEFTGYSRPAYSFLEDTCYTYEKWTTGTFSGIYYFGSIDDEKLLSGEYDLNTSKLRPPVSRFLYMYGYQLICGHVLGFWDFENNLSSYTNNDLIMYSDMSLGDTPESFSENNRQLIGETHDGEIVGMGRVSDSLIVFKDRGVHAIDGVLMPGAYSRRTIDVTGVGCETFKSIVETGEALFFQSYDGIFVTNGYKITEASLNFFEMFKDIDPKKTRGTINPDFNEVLMFCSAPVISPGVEPETWTFVFNYENGDTYIWDSIEAKWGLLTDNDRNVLVFGKRDDGKVLKLDKTVLNDVGEPIEAFITTSFLDLDQPGLLKKINEFRLYSFSNKGQKVGFKLFGNWNKDIVLVQSEIEEFSDANVKTKNQKTGTHTAMSFALELSNNVVDEDLCISDYFLDVEINQMKDKNVK